MGYIITLAAVVLIAAILYLAALRPHRGRQAALQPFKDVYIAHRGLFNNVDVPENSIPAFRAAVDAGYGIELDVQITADGKPVVFHDETLTRMCGDTRVLHKLTYSELSELSLLNTDEKIPLLADVLAVIDGAVPLVVEIKSEGRYLVTSELAARMLAEYSGVYCVESFHPMVLRWFKQHDSSVIRGQLSTNHMKDGTKQPWIVNFLLTNLLLNFMAKPDFIAYNHRHKRQLSYRICRRLYSPVNVAWTIRSQDELLAARDVFDVFIFDSFIPNE